MENNWNKRIEDIELSEKIRTTLDREGIDSIESERVLSE